MTTIALSPHLAGVFDRAGISPDEPDVRGVVDSVCRQAGAGADYVLEISRARFGSDNERVRDVLVVLTRTGVALHSAGKRSLFSRSDPTLTLKPFAEITGVIDNDEAPFGPSVFFLSRDDRDVFALMWDSVGQRDRMYMPIFWAHAGRFENWGLKLDPAAYVDDFTRFYEELVSNAPASDEGVRDFVREKYGVFDLANALGFAEEWRRCELSDAAPGGDSSSRLGRIGFPYPWIEAAPTAPHVLVRLAEPLFEAGAMGPPYDEVTFETGEEITSMDAGPRRLIALMTLAAHAHAMRHSRADEFVAAARKGIGAAPPSVFSPQLRELWAPLGGVPGGNGP